MLYSRPMLGRKWTTGKLEICQWRDWCLKGMQCRPPYLWVKQFLKYFSLHHFTPCWKFGSLFLGFSAASAVLPIPSSVWSISVCPDSGMAASAWEFECVHTAVDACFCTHGQKCKRVCMESCLWEKSPCHTVDLNLFSTARGVSVWCSANWVHV